MRNLIAIALMLLPSNARAEGQTTSANMGLTIPGVGVTSGPQWASDLNTSLNVIDLHDHSSGKGVQITPSGFNFSSDLACQSHNITGARSLRLQPYANSGSFNATASDIGALFEIAPDLYYRDGNGNSIQITSGGFVNAGAGSITGLSGYPNASASYNGAQGTFIWQQAVSTAAHTDAGSVIIRYAGSYPTPSGNYTGFQAPSTLATGYFFTMPTVTPVASGAWLTSSTAGVLSYTNTDNSTVEISSATLRVKDSGITGAKLNSNVVDNSTLQYSANQLSIKNSGVGTNQIADGAVTPAKKAALGQQFSSGNTFSTTSGSFVDVTSLSISITTTGRPVFVAIVDDGVALGGSGLFQTSGAAPPSSGDIAILRAGVIKCLVHVATGDDRSIPGNMICIDTPGAGTYTYKVQARNNDGVTTTLNYVRLVAYEL